MGRRSDTGVSQKTCQNRCMFYSFREIKLRNKSGFFYYRQPVRHQATHSSEISPPVSRVRFFPKSQYSRLMVYFRFLPLLAASLLLSAAGRMYALSAQDPAAQALSQPVEDSRKAVRPLPVEDPAETGTPSIEHGMEKNRVQSSQSSTVPGHTLSVEDSTAMSFDLDEFVVYGSPLMREVIPVQKLSGEQLKNLSSFSVADAIRYFSGVQLKDYGGVGGLKTVNVRSMGAHHVGD